MIIRLPQLAFKNLEDAFSILLMSDNHIGGRIDKGLRTRLQHVG